MRVIQADNTEMINIGRQLENLATEVVFDLSNWIAEFGDGAAALIVRRVGDSNDYPVSLERQGSKATWKVTNADTELAQKGRYGRCELRWYVGDVLAKSHIWKLYVEPSMVGQSSVFPPSPEQSWFNKVLEAGTVAENAATNAKDSAFEAKASEDNAAKSATDAKAAMTAAQVAQIVAEDAKSVAVQSAQEAAGSASAASTSETNAKASEVSAKASETAAQESKTAAAGSASAAANSAASASAAASAASESATEAAASKTAAKSSEEAAKASETAAKASETAAAESASAAQQAANEAKADADTVATLAEEVAAKAIQTANNATLSVQAKEAAQTAQRLAEAAQQAAETARTAANAAQVAAEQSATDAAGAKRDAETAMKSAQDAAAAAAKALTDIQVLYQEMQTWANSAIQNINSAGSTAVQSVQSAGNSQVQRVTAEGTTQTANAKAQADAAAMYAESAQAAKEALEQSIVENPGSIVIDPTLSIVGAAAEAASVGKIKQDVAAITPDDTAVNEKPWTSKKIVDTLCQPIEETGNPVQCYPVENYPMGVKVQIEPTQEGSGDPSPDNIRPITGRDVVSVTRCGRNYIDIKSLDKLAISSCKYASTEKGFRITAYLPGTFKPCLFYLPTDIVLGKTITVSAELAGKTNDVTPGIRIIAYKDQYIQQAAYADRDFDSVGIRYSVTVKMPDTLPEGCKGFSLNFYCTKGTNANIDDYSEYANVQIELGSTATPYEPYTGDTYDIALPETVYGGTLDVETGVLTVTHYFVTLTGNENWGKSGNYLHAPITPKGKSRISGACTHFPYWDGVGDLNYGAGNYVTHAGWAFIVAGGIGAQYTVEEWKAYLTAQKEAGTQVQVCYGLAETYTIQLSTQQITALSGVNTIYTDADGVIVTGAEDPKHTITELKNAIISLGGNV